MRFGKNVLALALICLFTLGASCQEDAISPDDANASLSLFKQLEKAAEENDGKKVDEVWSKIIAEGVPEKVAKNKKSYTAVFLRDELK